MNEAVIPELELLLFSVLAGALSFAGYDILLVIRAFFRQSWVLEKLFDLLYWGCASVLVFSMIHEKNSGVIRGYSVLGMLAGMIAYRLAAKDRLVLGAQRRAEKLRKWCFKKWEPVRKKKKELQIRRRQSKIERREKRRSQAEQRRAAGQRQAAEKKARARSRREEKRDRRNRRKKAKEAAGQAEPQERERVKRSGNGS